MTCFNSDALTIDSDGMELLAAVVGTKPGDGSDQQFRAAFDPLRIAAIPASERRSSTWLQATCDLQLAAH